MVLKDGENNSVHSFTYRWNNYGTIICYFEILTTGICILQVEIM